MLSPENPFEPMFQLRTVEVPKWLIDEFAEHMAASVPNWAKPVHMRVKVPRPPRNIPEEVRRRSGRKTKAKDPEVRKRIVSMFKAGETREAISARFGVCTKTIRGVLKVEGLI